MRTRSILRLVRRILPSRPRPLILGYHRIADEPDDYWNLAVSPARFEEQLESLCRTRRPYPLVQFVQELKAGTLPADAVALTFDDGYVDNLIAAKPRLAKYGVPATVFLATGYLNRSSEFWWDELARMILCGKAPLQTELLIAGKTISLKCDTGSSSRRHVRVATTSQRETLRTVWQILRRLEDKEREAIMQMLRSAFAIGGRNDGRSRAMTYDEIKRLLDDGLITIGAHTVSHPLLVGLEASICRREIRESKATCDYLASIPVSSFAYPFGGSDKLVCEEVKNAGFAFACSTQYGPVVPSSDLFALPRVNIQNWDGHRFGRAIRSANVPV